MGGVDKREVGTGQLLEPTGTLDFKNLLIEPATLSRVTCADHRRLCRSQSCRDVPGFIVAACGVYEVYRSHPGEAVHRAAIDFTASFNDSASEPEDRI